MGFTLPKIDALVIGAAFVSMGILYAVVNHTRMGTAIRAVSEDKEAAALMGIDVNKVVIFTFALGGAMAFAVDHFVRPVLIGGATKLPFLWVLLGILGGLEVWGLLGLFLGPAIMAALILLWRDFVRGV